MSQTKAQLVDAVDGSIVAADLAADCVTTDKVANSAITDAKISGLTSSKLTGALPAISGAALTGIASAGKATNIVVNGSMQVAQRLNSTTTSSTTSGYGSVDRFKCEYSGTDEATTQSQSDVASGTTPYTLGFRKAMKVQNGNQTSGAGSSDRITILHLIEAQDMANSGWNYLSASSNITFSFWVKSSVAQNFYVRFKSADSTSQAYCFETGSLSADTWTKITKTIPGNSNIVFNNDNGEGLEITWEIFRGTDQTGSMSLNAWAASNNNLRTPDQTSTWWTTNDATFEITGVQLEVGSQVTPFEHRSFNEELLLCKRYFNMIGDGALGAGTAMSDGFIWNNSGTELDFMYTFPVQMRTTPSIYQVTGGNYFKILGGGLSNTTYVDGNFNIQYASKIATSQYATMDSSGTEGRSCHITINNTLTKYGYQAEL